MMSINLNIANVAMIVLAVSIVLFPSASQADTWRGTAPFCKGKCKSGETQIRTSKSGDGARCWTGKKVLCRNSESLCNSRQTKAKCWGVVLVCDNGSYLYSGAWQSCSKYACGVCFGFGRF